jgi:predicted thioesterase
MNAPAYPAMQAVANVNQSDTKPHRPGKQQMPMAKAHADRLITVDESRVINFMGPEMRVYATPSMIGDVEMVCRDLLLESLPTGQDSVGTFVEFHHTGAAKLGASVEIKVTVAQEDERRVVFEMKCETNGQVIGHGRHERAIVSIERLKKRLAGL